MPIRDLGKLFLRENRLFLVLIIWLIVGFTFIEFGVEFLIFGFVFNGIVIFMPLLIICIVLFLIAFFLQGDLKELNWSSLLRGGVFLFVVAALMYLFGAALLFLIGVVSVFVSFISYIFITSIFSMYYCFRYGMRLDDAFAKLPRPIAFFWRWFVYLAGTIIALLVIYVIGAISIGTTQLEGTVTILGGQYRINDIVRFVPLIIIGVILILLVISLLALIFGGNHALNAWLGVFFLFSSVYGGVLMVNAFLGGDVSNVSPLLDNPLTYALIFAFELILILYTISVLIGSKAEIILDLKVFKPIKPDGIMIFLILCKVAYEFGDILLADFEAPGGVNIVLLKHVAVFWLFIPLMFVMGIYGIAKYGKIKRERKTEQYFKKKQKTEDKEERARIKQQEKERLKREKEQKKQQKKLKKQS
jgi:hypothetical protein